MDWATLLTVVFVVLKLMHAINWSWWWVLSPFLISLGFSVLILTVVGVVFACNRGKFERLR
jgi:uncharacterized membrane protein YhaH (DUF805 family)